MMKSLKKLSDRFRDDPGLYHFVWAGMVMVVYLSAILL